MLVSVIIPVYNRSKFLPDTLNSVKAQTHRPLELIIVDNASSDGSRETAEKFASAQTDAAFTVRVATEKRRGAAACRNTGAHMATGRWLYFFDSDDLMSPDFLADALHAASDSTKLVVASTCIDDGRSKRRRVLNCCNSPEFHILTGELSTQSVLISSDLFSTVGRWNENLPRWNDWELGVRLLIAAPPTVRLQRKSYHVIRAHADSITGNDFSSSYCDLIAACRAVEHDLRGGTHKCANAIKALAYRVYILAGIFAREKSPAAARAATQYAETLLSATFHKLLGRAIMRYTAWGGRGAWRIALFALLKTLSPRN